MVERCLCKADVRGSNPLGSTHPRPARPARQAPSPADRETVHPTPRPSWPPFVLIALVVTVALASSATPSPLYVVYQQDWGVGGTTITVVYAVYALAVLIPLLFLGRVSDAIGRRPVILAGLVLLAVSMGMLAAAGSVARNTRHPFGCRYHACVLTSRPDFWSPALPPYALPFSSDRADPTYTVDMIDTSFVVFRFRL